MSPWLWRSYAAKLTMNKESDFLSVLDAIQWYIFLDVVCTLILGYLCCPVHRDFSRLLEGAVGTAGRFAPKFSTICSQEMERATSLTFRVFLPVAAGWSKLCLQILLHAPAPAVSLREPEPRETWCCISSEYHETIEMMIEMVTQTVYAQWVKMQKETKQYRFICAGSEWNFPLVLHPKVCATSSVWCFPSRAWFLYSGRLKMRRNSSL